MANFTLASIPEMNRNNKKKIRKFKHKRVQCRHFTFDTLYYYIYWLIKLHKPMRMYHGFKHWKQQFNRIVLPHMCVHEYAWKDSRDVCIRVNCMPTDGIKKTKAKVEMWRTFWNKQIITYGSKWDWSTTSETTENHSVFLISGKDCVDFSSSKRHFMLFCFGQIHV